MYSAILMRKPYKFKWSLSVFYCSSAVKDSSEIDPNNIVFLYRYSVGVNFAILLNLE